MKRKKNQQLSYLMRYAMQFFNVIMGSVISSFKKCCNIPQPILPEPMLTYHQWGPGTFIWERFHKSYLSHQPQNLACGSLIQKIPPNFTRANELKIYDIIWNSQRYIGRNIGTSKIAPGAVDCWAAISNLYYLRTDTSNLFRRELSNWNVQYPILTNYKTVIWPSYVPSPLIDIGSGF